MYRKDRIRCARGAELLRGHRLRDGSRTSRLVASCCDSAMVMWFEDARHWAPVYRARLGGDAPAVEMRIATKFAAASGKTSDVPSHRGYPLGLLGKLLAARVRMLAK